MFTPAIEVAVRLGCCVLDDRILARSIDAADFMRKIDLHFAIFLLQPFDPDLMKISVIHIVLTDKCGQYIGREVLQDVQLFRVSVVFQFKS